jgi:hypothetical protein
MVKDCVCYKCVAWLRGELKTNQEAFIDCACEGAPATYNEEKCKICDVKDICDIYLNPESYA